MSYKNTSRDVRWETSQIKLLSNFNMSESRMQGNLHVWFGVDLLISNEIGKLGHCCQWELCSLFLVDTTSGWVRF